MSDSGETNSPAPSQPEVLHTTLETKWVVKMVIFIVVLIGFGCWGLYDATTLYPNRGKAHAEYAQFRFLEAAKAKGRINTAATIEDPAARFDTLDAKIPRDDLEQTEHTWLQALSRLGRLNRQYTVVDSPSSTLDTLSGKWATQKQPLPLAAHDIPLQWAFTAIGFGLGIVAITNFLRSAKKKYSFEPATNTLTLDGGKRVKPDDLADVDKRKWHKFFCSLVFNDGSPSAELDLLKYRGLEEWVLTMERVRFPERAAEAEAEAAASEAAPSERPEA